MDNLVDIILNQLPVVTAAGIHEVAQPWMHRYRQVSVNTMILVIEGTLHVCEDGINYTLAKNHMMFFKANAVQDGYKLIDQGAKWFWVNFEEIKSEEIVSRVNSLPKTLAPSKIHELHGQINNIIELYRSHKPLRQEQVNGIFYLLLLRIASESFEGQSKGASKFIASNVIEVLGKQIYGGFDSEVISKSLDMNYKYICRKFKEETNKTMKQYYLTMKIEEAIRLFLTTSKNISEISDYLNFPNPYYFSRVFKQITGSAPRDYKKQLYQN